MLATLLVITEFRDREDRLRRRSELPRPPRPANARSPLRLRFGAWLVRLGVAVAGRPASAVWPA